MRPLINVHLHITPQYATQWRVIGTLLDLPSEVLNIEHDRMYIVDFCCNATMLEGWLQLDTTASQAKLLEVQCRHKGAGCTFKDQIRLMGDHLSTCLYEMVSCRHEKCTQQVLRKDLQKHEETCPDRIL